MIYEFQADFNHQKYLHFLGNLIIIYVELFFEKEIILMGRIKTLETRNLCESAKKGGCGECQTSCQSACKTSCGVANQKCENKEKK